MITMTLDNYHFRGVPKPFDHQVATTQFIVDTPRCFVFNDIGSGKTWSAVWAIDYLRVKHVLIVAPLSTLEIVWKRTFFYLDPSIDVEILRGSATKRKDLLNRPRGLSAYKVSIINPDALHIIADSIEDVDMVVVDESAMFRNSKSRRVRSLTAICKDIPRVVCMTGSPCPEAPTDIWATARIICPERVSRWFGKFRDLVMRKVSQFKWVALPDAQETVSKLLEGFHIRFRREDCIDLPPSHHAEIEVEASAQQKKLIHHIRKEAVAMVESGAIYAANEAIVVSKILQIASGAVRFSREDGQIDIVEIDCTPKFAALADIIESSTQPIILFAPFTAVIDKISKWLTSKSIPHSAVTGATPPSQRLTAFDSLQSGLIRLLVAHPAAMSHGITLTNSNIVVWWTPLYSHEIYEQANGRVVRPGQTRDTYFVHLVCTALESRVLRKLESKAAMQGTLLDYLQRSEL